MDGIGLIRNVGGSRLPSKYDLEDTNPANKIVPNTIKNIPSESPRSSLTAASRLSATELGFPQTPEYRPKAARKIEDDRLIQNMGGEDDLKDIDLVDEIFPNTTRNITSESPWSALTATIKINGRRIGLSSNSWFLTFNLHEWGP